MGALSITGIPAARQDFEPLVPGAVKVPNTNFYRAPGARRRLREAFGRWAADEIARAIEYEGPDTVAAVFLEPVQNSGGCFPPPPGYFARVREICDRYDVLLVSDEVICAFGRLGHLFGADRYGYQPDIITCAKGMTSGYSPIGAMLVSDRMVEPFLHGSTSFLHGFTFAGHPVSAAVALANLDIFEREDLPGHVLRTEGAFRATLEKLLDLPIVGEVRGDGFFYGIELVKDKATRQTFDDDESERLLRGFLSRALFDAGLYCRADDRGDPVVQLAPPLICDQEQFDEIEQILRSVLTEAWTRDLTTAPGVNRSASSSVGHDRAQAPCSRTGPDPLDRHRPDLLRLGLGIRRRARHAPAGSRVWNGNARAMLLVTGTTVEPHHDPAGSRPHSPGRCSRRPRAGAGRPRAAAGPAPKPTSRTSPRRIGEPRRRPSAAHTACSPAASHSAQAAASNPPARPRWRRSRIAWCRAADRDRRPADRAYSSSTAEILVRQAHTEFHTEDATQVRPR